MGIGEFHCGAVLVPASEPVSVIIDVFGSSGLGGTELDFSQLEYVSFISFGGVQGREDFVEIDKLIGEDVMPQGGRQIGSQGVAENLSLGFPKVSVVIAFETQGFSEVDRQLPNRGDVCPGEKTGIDA